MTPKQLASYQQWVQQGVAYWEDRRSGAALLPHEVEVPAVLAQLRRDIDAGYRISHQGWNGA